MVKNYQQSSIEDINGKLRTVTIGSRVLPDQFSIPLSHHG